MTTLKNARRITKRKSFFQCVFLASADMKVVPITELLSVLCATGSLTQLSLSVETRPKKLRSQFKNESLALVFG